MLSQVWILYNEKRSNVQCATCTWTNYYTKCCRWCFIHNRGSVLFFMGIWLTYKLKNIHPFAAFVNDPGFITHYCHILDSTSWQAKIIFAGGAFWGRGQSSRDPCCRGRNTFSSPKSPERNTDLQTVAGSAYNRRPCDQVVEETRHIPSLVQAPQLIPVRPSIIYPAGKRILLSKWHNQPRAVTSPAGTSRYTDISTEKLLK